MKNKYLISGSEGYIGSSLREFLKLKKNRVLSIGKGNSVDLKFNFGKRNKEIKLPIKNKYFDYFIHLELRNEVAFRVKPNISNIENLNSILNAIEITKKYNIKKLIYFSTYHVYKKDLNIINEYSNVEPKDLYSNSHLFSENLIKNMLEQNQYVILRVPNIYGLNQVINFKRNTLLPFSLCNQIINEKKIVLTSNGNQVKNFISIESILHFINQNKFPNNLINLAGKDNLTIFQYAKKIKNYYEKITLNKAQIYCNKKDKKEFKKNKFESFYFKSKYDNINKFILSYLTDLHK